MLWEHEPQASVSTAFSSSPNTIFNQSARVRSLDCFLNTLSLYILLTLLHVRLGHLLLLVFFLT